MAKLKAPTSPEDAQAARAADGPPQARTPAVPDVELSQPTHVDRHFMEAYTRYVGLLANGVTHHRALAAVQVVDPNFDLDEEAALAILKALNKNDEPVKLAERLYVFAQTAPPGHVTDVFNSLEFTEEAEQALADAIYALHQDAWVAAMNENLSRLGLANITRVTDEEVLTELRTLADQAARSIVNTYNGDLASALYATYIEHHAVLGRQSSETILREAMEEWIQERAGWKSEQVATQQTNLIFNMAMRWFRSRNSRLNAEFGRVVPLGGQCDACQDASMLGLQSAEIIIELNMPLHVGCVHSIEWQFGPDADTEGGVWTGSEESQAAEEG